MIKKELPNMPELPQKKVGLVACSGEELPEGTVTRLAALKVLEEMRPADTVTICLPLFLAGGEGDRAFARFYPTIAIDGCEKRCAARATEMHSGKPAASIVVSELVAARGLSQPQGLRSLDHAGRQAVEATAEVIALKVDELLGKSWSRREGQFVESAPMPAKEPEAVEASCACGSGIPMQVVEVDGKRIHFLALPLIFEQFRIAGKGAGDGIVKELLETTGVYNQIPDEAQEKYARALLEEYRHYLQEKEPGQ
jgi:uncharacterized metal-binding protein